MPKYRVKTVSEIDTQMGSDGVAESVAKALENAGHELVFAEDVEIEDISKES